ncbi:MAG TPA: HAD-IA family hydrolase [Candidatus Paceibacterota bacterium]|jgi:haloacid dehalogenase superfamily, subfamily IA, variant 3 with third motif having DD or ED
MLKAAIFDLNGIFLQSPKLSDRFQSDFGIPVATFLPKLSSIMDAARKPNAGNSFKLWEPALKEWRVSISESEFWDYWFKAEKVSESMVSFAKELRTKGIKVFILSNNFKERAEYYDHYPWVHDAVDKIFFSWQTGFVKPDTRAWTSILEEHGLKADQCVYFDDQEKNLKAAESVGIKSYMFTDEKDLERIVRGLL